MTRASRIRMPTTIATVSIAEAGGTTTMSIESRFSSREAMEQVVEMGMAEGITEAVGQIDGIVGGE
jgi:hypothetical protein